MIRIPHRLLPPGAPRLAIGLPVLGLLLGLAFGGRAAEGLSWRLGAGEPARAELRLVQRLRAIPGDLAEGPRRLPLLPEEWSDRFGDLHRRLTARLRLRPAGPERLLLEVEDFDLQARMGETDLDPVGAEQMSGLELALRWGPRGPAGPIGPADTGGLDASQWSVMQPLAETLSAFLQLSLAILPARPPQPGDCWTATRQVPAGLADAPGATMEVWSLYVLTGYGPCGEAAGGRAAAGCARIEEILVARADGYRRLGDSVIGLDLQGVGRASHRIGLGTGASGSVRGELGVELRFSSRPAAGMPPDYTTINRIASSWRLQR